MTRDSTTEVARPIRRPISVYVHDSANSPNKKTYIYTLYIVVYKLTVRNMQGCSGSRPEPRVGSAGLPNLTGRVGSGGVRNLTGRVESGQEVFKNLRAGPGRVR